jgi:drug/metabolite transporter (DMT)-like permease
MSARAWAGFAAMSVLWGIPYLFIKVAVDGGMAPAAVAWVRVVLAAAILLVLAWRAGSLPTLRGSLRWVAAYAILEIAIPFPLIAAGEQHVASSLAAIVIAAVPLLVALLALRFDHAERATGRRLVGLLIGLAGVVALMGIDVAGKPDEMLGAAAVMVAAVGYAAGPMVLKRKLSALDPRATMGGSLAIAAVALTPFAALAPPSRAPGADVIASLVVLGVACTALAFVIFGALIAEIGPGRTLVITYVNPVVAVALGVTILGERPGAGAVAGLLLILAGSWLSTDGRLPPGLAAVIERRRRRRRTAQSSEAAIRRSKPAGA